MTKDKNQEELIEFIGEKFEKVDQKFEKVDKRLDRQSAEIIDIKQNMATKNDIAEIRKSIDKLTDTIDKYIKKNEELRQEFTVLREKVRRIEKHLGIEV